MISDKEKELLAKQQAEERALEEGLEDEEPQSSPEHVSDDDVYPESDFQPMERTGEGDDERFWEVEECIDVEEEEAPPRKVLRVLGEPTKAEWEEHRIDHQPYRSSNTDGSKRKSRFLCSASIMSWDHKRSDTRNRRR